MYVDLNLELNNLQILTSFLQQRSPASRGQVWLYRGRKAGHRLSMQRPCITEPQIQQYGTMHLPLVLHIM